MRPIAAMKPLFWTTSGLWSRMARVSAVQAAELVTASSPLPVLSVVDSRDRYHPLPPPLAGLSKLSPARRTPYYSESGSVSIARATTPTATAAMSMTAPVTVSASAGGESAASVATLTVVVVVEVEVAAVVTVVVVNPTRARPAVLSVAVPNPRHSQRRSLPPRPVPLQQVPLQPQLRPRYPWSNAKCRDPTGTR